MFVYIQFYIDIYVRFSIGGHNLGTFNAWKLKFGMLLTETFYLNSTRVALIHTPDGVRTPKV